MGKHAYYRQQSVDDAMDADQPDDDDHLTEFRNLIFNELLCNIKKMQFANIINNLLTTDGVKRYGTIQSNSLKWLYTADRKKIKDKIIYSFRFASPCNPDYYKSFVTKHHPFFALSYQIRHDLEEWYEYTGQGLPKEIENYLNIAKVMNEQTLYKTKIFVNNMHERLDIEFHFQSGGIFERITITFEPGYPAS